ncbi:DDE-type integrase/transposase/recombinase [Halanaerobium saccharolyticum]|uniref:DDE-type integrase/transposase/recombinase n=1 Tax=Halanaerobium saccharolyticum TaxID=43595 RepID=UPI0014170E1C
MISGYICLIYVFTREIISHHEGLSCRTKEALKALNKAAENRNTDDRILRTDNGVQFRSREFQTRIRELDISHERTMVNTSEENLILRAFTVH